MFILQLVALLSLLVAGVQVLAIGNVIAGVSLIGSGSVISAGTYYLYSKKAKNRKKPSGKKSKSLDCCDFDVCD
ncbi:hypothetical protein QUF84_03215 [Fictibacillus enclensis]|uniref:hypothetical protein n=1 Tax=Fictibacillus enclensis TaxID=1017270 RepID=UPI0025A29719|nr:hypothetical protein [Fictibacillus enclensis]MDM5336246.1 hypothetical protein [Fictibacillus enclensis]